MIHFFPKYASDVEHTPFAQELRRLGAPYRMFAKNVNRQYKSRLELVLRIYPTLVWVSFGFALRSLAPSRTRPDFVVITSDVEALVFGMMTRLLSNHTQVVFETFIATPRRGRAAQLLHRIYYALVLRLVDIAICHSEVEARDYATMFPGVRTQFVCVPYALSLVGRETLRQEHDADAMQGTVIVAAGRSGRDYATLANAIHGLPCTLRIICDWEKPIAGLAASDQITILRQCFRQDYLRELAKARIVVVPLSLTGISAGQMVILHAFALGKPVIVTDTDTTREYARDEYDAALVRFGDAKHMRETIARLLADPALCRRLGDNAARRYDECFSTEAYVRKLVATLDPYRRPAVSGQLVGKVSPRRFLAQLQRLRPS